MASKVHRVVEELLQVTLPDDVTAVHFFRSEPSPDLHYFDAYAKFATSRESFLRLVETMKMGLRGRNPEANAFLPASWDGPREVDLGWWKPTADTPEDSAARAYGVNGWVVAKYEDGVVYLKLTDTGADRGTPGPW